MAANETRQQVACLYRLFRDVLPRAAVELARWERRAAAIPNPELRRQALASLRAKRFHAEGGSVFAAAGPAHGGRLTGFIVAFQTASDYLDNLCDRSVSRDGDDFRQLHRALEDAVDPAAPPADYYALHPNREDGGYLRELVEACRRHAGALPGFAAVQGEVRRLIALYVDLQVFKHVAPGEREALLRRWYARERPADEDLHWWEFGAAAGSTLAVFALLAEAAAGEPAPGAAARLRRAYFPWVCGLHILLDYWIDQAEDAEGRDLNFIRHYAGPGEVRRRLRLFHRRARGRVARLPQPALHTLVVDGLLGLYLSDDKVAAQGLDGVARELLRGAGPRARALHALCAARRRASRRRRAPHPPAGPLVKARPGC